MSDALRFRLLGSGSSGNATLVESGSTRILLDAGLGPRKLVECLELAGVAPDSLDAIILSHEHGDHSRGVASLSRRFGIQVAGTRGTQTAMAFGDAKIAGYTALGTSHPLRIGALSVTGVSIPHDAAEPIAFVVSTRGASFGHATDLGHIDRGLVAAFRRCDALLLESNYDSVMLREGPYPWSLKERILSPMGHISNADVARYITRGLGPDCRTLVLAHLSRKNNHPEVARMSAEQALNQVHRDDVHLEVSGSGGTEWIDVMPMRRDVENRIGQLRLF